MNQDVVNWKLEFYQTIELHRKWEMEVWLPRYLKVLREYYLALSEYEKT